MRKIKKKSSRQGHPDLSLEQRQEIFRLRKARLSIQKISDLVRCSKSTVSTTLNHPALAKYHKHLPWYEKARIVHLAIKKNRGRPRETSWGLKNEVVRSYVYLKLKDKLSPKNISLQISKDRPGESISHEAIYQFCYKADRTLIKYLVRHGKTKRNNRAKNCNNRLRVAEKKLVKRNIEERCKEANERVDLGHLESDFVVSCRGGKACLLVVIDRKTRVIELRLLPNRLSRVTRRAIFQIFNKLPDGQRRSLTLDNDTAHNRLPMLERVFSKDELKVLFCNPYSPWERGSVEAIIGILRRWFPKGTNFDQVTKEKVQYVQDWFNNRPMEVLDGDTPNEVWEREMMFELAA